MGSIEPPSKAFSKIIIAGAGPAGLLLALLLSQHDIPSLVLESWDRLDGRLRATQYGVPATKILRRAGILDEIRDQSIASFPSISWRKVSDHTRLTGIDLSVVKDEPDRMVILPLNQIIEIMYRHCIEKGKGLVEIQFNHKVVATGQDADSAWVDVEIGEEGEEKETKRFSADYVVGCDGATSTVRKSLFGREWPGQTHPFRLMVQNVCFLHLSWPQASTDRRGRFGTTGLKNTAGTAAITWSTTNSSG
jgi:2-polyprenyl-6-methoxyphenol hydroxylase-like FAD-dependent oxidoreductase